MAESLQLFDSGAQCLAMERLLEVIDSSSVHLCEGECPSLTCYVETSLDWHVNNQVMCMCVCVYSIYIYIYNTPAAPFKSSAWDSSSRSAFERSATAMFLASTMQLEESQLVGRGVPCLSKLQGSKAQRKAQFLSLCFHSAFSCTVQFVLNV